MLLFVYLIIRVSIISNDLFYLSFLLKIYWFPAKMSEFLVTFLIKISFDINRGKKYFDKLIVSPSLKTDLQRFCDFFLVFTESDRSSYKLSNK